MVEKLTRKTDQKELIRKLTAEVANITEEKEGWRVLAGTRAVELEQAEAENARLKVERLIVARNIAGSPATVVEWSAKVGEALDGLGDVLKENARLTAENENLGDQMKDALITWCTEKRQLKTRLATVQRENEELLKELLNNEAARDAYHVKDMMLEIDRELDRLGAPKLQPSGFGLSPIGRLRVLNAEIIGEHYGYTLDILMAEKKAIQNVVDAVGYYLSIPVDTEDSVDALVKLSIAYHKAPKETLCTTTK